jgi:hypothetical protein
MLSHQLWYVAWFGRHCGKDAIALRRGLRHGKGGALKATICRKSSSWCSWGFLVLSCFAEKLWSQAVISRDNSADFFGKSRNRWGLNAAATAVEDDDKDSVAAMLHRQLRIYKGGSPEEPVWFPDI